MKKLTAFILSIVMVLAFGATGIFGADGDKITCTVVGDSSICGYALEDFDMSSFGFGDGASKYSTAALLKNELEKKYGKDNVTFNQYSLIGTNYATLHSFLNTSYTAQTNDQTWIVEGMLSYMYSGDALGIVNEMYSDALRDADVIVLDQSNNIFSYPTFTLFCSMQVGSYGATLMSYSETKDTFPTYIQNLADIYEEEYLTALTESGDEQLEYMADVYKNAYAYYMYNFNWCMEWIYLNNPDADVIVIGAQNEYKGWYADCGEETFSSEDALFAIQNEILDGKYADDFTYVDLSDKDLNKDLKTLIKNIAYGTESEYTRNTYIEGLFNLLGSLDTSDTTDTSDYSSCFDLSGILPDLIDEEFAEALDELMAEIAEEYGIDMEEDLITAEDVIAAYDAAEKYRSLNAFMLNDSENFVIYTAFDAILNNIRTVLRTETFDITNTAALLEDNDEMIEAILTCILEPEKGTPAELTLGYLVFDQLIEEALFNHPNEAGHINKYGYIKQAYAEQGTDNAYKDFTDVANDDYYADAVRWGERTGVIYGTSETEFSPNVKCTRGQILTMLYRAAGSPEVTGTCPFEDVEESDYYYDAVIWGVQNGIAKGVSTTQFAPELTCRRGQIACFLYRFAGEPEVTEANIFDDVAKGDYYYDAIRWAYAEGLTVGTSVDKFSPEAFCTRAQTITFIHRYMLNAIDE